MKASGAQLGAVIDPEGEHITLTDDTGRVLEDDVTLYCFLKLLGITHEKPRVGLPVAVPRAFQEVCQEHGAEIVWTKLSTPHLMEIAATANVDFVGSQEGGYIFPSFLPAYDATAAFMNLVAMLAD